MGKCATLARHGAVLKLVISSWKSLSSLLKKAGWHGMCSLVLGIV
jgi:hypothetical protein